nr:ankyrin repeat-containing domain, PGG domain protein [Tanacetum cinerariifolium]
MMNAASTSHPSIVTLKLSGKSQYNLWRLQMECLLKSQHMVGYIDGQFPGNGKEKVGDMDAIASDSLVKENTLLDMKNIDGSTLLHVATIGGNIEAVNILTSKCLFEHMKVHGYGVLFSGQSGKELVVLAISCQDFSLAKMI